ncbi:MAG TPA: hypothetical protein VJ728_14275 [Candidatus Binataceae bacterium]|nr:hypothetical protein [Candidatus Binataceae bacterium]
MSGENKNQPASDDDANLVAGGRVLARWLGISGKAVYDLAKAGILVRAGRDQFSLEESVRRYCEHIRQAASRDRNARGHQGINGADHRTP